MNTICRATVGLLLAACLLPIPAGAEPARTPFVLPQVDTQDFDCLASRHLAVFRVPREDGGMDVTFHGGGDAELTGNPARAAGRRVESHLAFNGVITIRSCPGAARPSEIVVDGEKLVFAVEEGGKLAYVGGRGSVTAAGVVTRLRGRPPLRLGAFPGDPDPAALAPRRAMVEDTAPLGEVETALGFRPGATRHDEFMEKVESGACQSKPATPVSFSRGAALVDVRRYRGVVCKPFAPMDLAFLNGVLVACSRADGRATADAAGGEGEAWKALLSPILDDARLLQAFRPISSLHAAAGGSLQLQAEDDRVKYVVNAGEKRIRVALSFDTSDARTKAAFAALAASRREIAREAGVPLRSQYTKAEMRYSSSGAPRSVDRGVIFVDLDVSPDSPEEDRAELRGWVVDCLLNLKRAVVPRIRRADAR